jgi:hypothetical protein
LVSSNYSAKVPARSGRCLYIQREAARVLIREKGYEHATLEDTVARAGMTTGTLPLRNDAFGYELAVLHGGSSF